MIVNKLHAEKVKDFFCPCLMTSTDRVLPRPKPQGKAS